MRGLSTSPPLLPLFSSQPLYSSQQTRSTLLPPPPSTSSDATLLALKRQIAYLRQTLQTLLDAQSLGLLAGLGHPTPTPRNTSPLSNPSRPLSSSTLSPGPSPRAGKREDTERRGPQEPKAVGLDGARRGISRTLRDLATLSEQSSSLLSANLSTRTRHLHVLIATAQRRHGILSAIRAIEDDPETGRKGVRKLANEEQEVERELREAEERVRELRARRERVRRNQREAEGRLEARLSSWKGSLAEIEAETRRLVQAAIIPGEKGIRKTLESVSEAAEKECSAVATAIEASDREQEACLQGRELWLSVIQTVSSVEDGLRNELRGLLDPPKAETELLPMHNKDASTNERTKYGMKSVRILFSTAITSLESALQASEDRDWRFLTCAIGAELAALQEGQEMLGSMAVDAEVEDGAGIGDERGLIDVERDGGVGLGSSSQRLNERQKQRKDEDEEEEEEEEEDGPGADLLVEGGEG